ncbi:MAG: hypothetical protein AB7G37_04530 [Solirubrobacteraceae bacterium]
MVARTWNITLTPQGAEPRTLEGVSQADATRILSSLVRGTDPSQIAAAPRKDVTVERTTERELVAA